MPLVVLVTKSIVPFIGLQTRPRKPLPNPTERPFIPPYLAPLTGSVMTPVTAVKTLVSIDLVPRATPDTTLDG